MQVMQGKGAVLSLPEHWKQHLQKVKKGDERRMQRYGRAYRATCRGLYFLDICVIRMLLRFNSSKMC